MTKFGLLPPVFPVLSERDQSIMRALLVMAGIDGFGQVVDFGCGEGRWLPILAELNQGVVGIDPDVPSLVKAGMRNIPNVALYSGENLWPTIFGPMDAIVAVNVMGPIGTRWRELLQQAHALLKPGGLFLFDTFRPETVWHHALTWEGFPDFRRWLGWIEAARRSLDSEIGPGRYYAPSRAALRSLAHSRGFTAEELGKIKLDHHHWHSEWWLLTKAGVK